MQLNKRNISMVFLILGMAFITIGISTDNETFSFIAIVFVVISLMASINRKRPGKK